MLKKIAGTLLLLFLLADLGYTFYQHLQVPLDGDISGGVLPNAATEKIFSDPFGIKVITENAYYPNPNRYFAHAAFSAYFRTAPFAFQKTATPLHSIYMACAFAKTLIQLLLMVLLAKYITGTKHIFKKESLLAMALVTPLFQTNGYGSYIGIIDHSVTYTFFYALPCALLALFFLPFFNTSFYGKPFAEKPLTKIMLLLLAIILPLSGALVPGVLLICSLLLLYMHRKKKAAGTPQPPTRFYLFLLALSSVLSIYSLYLGTHNSIFSGELMPIAERYTHLPKGLFLLLTQKIGFPVLLLMLALNFYLCLNYPDRKKAKQLAALYSYTGLFALLYILLLPLGGYKHYRPEIIRYDTFMPVTLALVFLYGITACHLLLHFKRPWYIALVIGFSVIFMLADKPETGKNACEKAALEQLSQAVENPVLISPDCMVLSWEKISDPAASTANATLLQYWGLTNDVKRYYQK